MSPTRKSPRTGHALFSPAFVITGLVLIAAALGLRPVLGVFERHYSKEPIALNKSLDDLDASRLESFELATGQVALTLSPGDLDTEDFIAPVFAPKSGRGETRMKDHTMLFVSYYSDPRERISHTPEVCYRQGGAVVERIMTIPVEIPGVGRVEARLLDISQQGARRALLYVLVCNGKVYHDRETVRFVIGFPGDKYTYFSKIETTKPVYPEESFDDAVELCKGLMREALPILLEDHYPTREQVQR